MTDNTKDEVARDEALSFCETAMRNWQYVAFSEDELDDLRVGLERFLSDRLTSQPAQSDLVEARPWAHMLSEFADWPDSELVHLCLAPPPGEHGGEKVVASTLGQLRRSVSTPTAPQPDRESVLLGLREVYENLTPGRIEAADIDGMAFKVEAAIKVLTHPTTDTQSDAVRDGPEITYEVWEDDLLVASSSSLADAGHYLAVYSQDAEVRLVKAETYRTPIHNEAADTGGEV